MDTSVERLTLVHPGTDVPAGFCELGTLQHNGHAYTSGGACVDPERLTAYLSGAAVVPTVDHSPTAGTYPSPGAYHVTADGRTVYSPAPIFTYKDMRGRPHYEPRFGNVTTWSGDVIGQYYVSGQSRGFHGTRLYHVRITLRSGAVYIGKGTGSGMLIRARRSSTQLVLLSSPYARRARARR